MVSVLVDDWLYVDVDGKCAVYGRKEAERTLKPKIKTMNAAFLDYQTKVISLVNKEQGYIDKIVNESFDQGDIVVQERLSADLVQIIGAKKEKIEGIYRDFEGIHITSLVPYAIAIRAVLKSRNLLEGSPYVIFLDDMGNQTVLTFFEGTRFSNPRQINLPDPSYIISEIKRSWQGFVSDVPHQQNDRKEGLCLVSNNKQWLTQLVSDGFITNEHIVYLDCQYPVLLGLSQAKFSLHFALAQEIIKQKKRVIFKRRIRTLIASVLIILFAGGSYLVSLTSVHQEYSKAQLLVQDKRKQEVLLRSIYQNNFLSFMDSQDTYDYQRIYFDFVRALPGDYLIDSFKLQQISNDSWDFEAVIYPQNEKTIPADFNGERFYLGTRVAHIITHKVLGQLITCRFNLKENSL